MRRDFILPEQDTDFLNSCGYLWETVRDGNTMWVIIHNYPVPIGYNITHVDVALNIGAGYPVAQIDMVYFHPHLSRSNGRNIGAIAHQAISGINWQRWSRLYVV